MIIGERIRLLRETKKLSQGDIEKRTGLLRCYISRVENGHTVPAIETLEKLARAMEVPLYQLFYDGEEPPELPNLPKRKSADDIAWGSTGKKRVTWAVFAGCWARIEEARPPPAALHGPEDGQPLRFSTSNCSIAARFSARCRPQGRRTRRVVYSHSIVLGGFELMS